MKAICRGLDHLHFGDLIKSPRHPKQTCSLFVAEENPEITAAAFLNVTTCEVPQNEDQARAQDYFKEFIKCIESK